MVKFAGAIAGALLLSACGSSIELPLASPSRSTFGFDSPAADLRTHMDLLLGEHAYVMAKLAIAAAAGRKDEFHSYAGTLVANGSDLTKLMRSALGETEGSQLGQLWSAGSNFFVDYVVAAATHDQAGADAAMKNLTGMYAPQLAQLLASSLSLSMDDANQLASDQVSGVKLVVDDAVASDFSKLYADVRAGYAKAVRSGDVLAAAVVSRFADRFPGDGQGKAATFRGAVDTLLMAQAYFMTMASDATVLGNTAETNAANDALAATTTSLSVVLGGVFGDATGTLAQRMWAQEAQLVLTYAESGADADRQNVLSAATPAAGGLAYSLDLSAELSALLKAVDDQRARSYDKLADDDRAAALKLAAAGDTITAAAVRQAPAKFA